MNITVLCVGQVKEKFYRDAIAEYSKRLSRYGKLHIIEVADDEEPVESLGAFNMYWLNTAGDLNYPEFRTFVNDFPVNNPELWDSYCESTMPF